MSAISPRVRHHRRLLVWTIAALAAITVLALTAGTPSASVDGRHLLAVAVLVGLVLEAEWRHP